MAIQLNKQVTFQTGASQPDYVKVTKEGSGSISLELSRVLKDGEVESYTMYMVPGELDALIRALQENTIINQTNKDNMETSRAELVVGTTYYMNKGCSEDRKGVFVGRDDDSIYFDLGGDQSCYHPSRKKGMEMLVPFNLEGGGFIEVK